MKKIVYLVLIATLFFGNMQMANANPLAAAAADIVKGSILDVLGHVIGKIAGSVIEWIDGSEEDVQQAEMESPLDFDGDGDSNGDGYNPDDQQQQ
ncbi:MAG: hypothetical protein RL637_1753 [Pseudomonadota bacterium]|jgi:hypothetical protein